MARFQRLRSLAARRWVWLLVAVVALVASTAASAQSSRVILDLRYDDDRAMERFIIVDLYLRTRFCMRDAALAMLRQGSRDRLQVRGFMLARCAAPLRMQLLARSRWTSADTDAFLAELAQRTLAEVITPF